jgi:inhibitor of cysteine peptidase
VLVVKKMQRDIKKKTITYGIAAVLLVSVLAATIYNVGVQFNPANPVFSELKTFSNLEEMQNFIATNMAKANQNQNTYAFDALKDGAQRNDLDSQTESNGAIAPTASDEYSSTNLQVAGVDEADIVKSDGEYLYVVADSTIYIVKAYPSNQARIVSRISLDDIYGAQIYVVDNKLVVLADKSIYYLYREPATGDGGEVIVGTSTESNDGDSVPPTEGNDTTPNDEKDILIAPYYYYNSEVQLTVYDITNKANPVLARTLTVNGTLSGSRMIGDYVYVVTSQSATEPNSNNENGFDVVLPVIGGDTVKNVAVDEIRYIDVVDQYYTLTTIIAVNAVNDGATPTYESFLAGQTANMYVSQDNMYLVVPDTNNWLFFAQSSAEESKQETLVYRVKLDLQSMNVEAQGSVEGFVNDQYSMDEYNGYFRIATTVWMNSWTDEGFTSDSTNNLFVLDMNLNTVGKLENLAQGESIYATRFMGDKVYLVTFRQVDPFFVIDTTNPTQPTVLGYLKIPGYSGYLHPYDATHIIGIGQENSTLKLSLFDVTDYSNPVEVAKYVVDADWSDSQALWDHKAFLFEKSKNLLALPVTKNNYNTISRVDVDPDSGVKEEYVESNGSYFQGAYVFSVTAQGFTLRGEITHHTEADQYEWDATINRILYIGDVLYTVSSQMVKLNSLESLAPLAEIQLS